MEVKTKQQQLNKGGDELNNVREKLEKEINDQMEKLQRAEKTL